MGEVRAQTSPGTCPVLGLEGASSVGPRLPGPACPMGLWERGQRGCQRMGGHCYARALVGSDSSWLLGVFGARHLTGPCWLAAVFLFRSGREGSPCAHLVPPAPPGGGKGLQKPLAGCSTGASSTPFQPGPDRRETAEPFIPTAWLHTFPVGLVASPSLSFHLHEMGASFPFPPTSQSDEGPMR